MYIPYIYIYMHIHNYTYTCVYQMLCMYPYIYICIYIYVHDTNIYTYTYMSWMHIHRYIGGWRDETNRELVSCRACRVVVKWGCTSNVPPPGLSLFLYVAGLVPFAFGHADLPLSPSEIAGYPFPL